MTARLRRLARDEQGRVTAFVVILSTACLLCAGLVLDGGMALAAKVRAIGQAQEAARAGAQQLDLTTYRDTSSVTLQPAAAIAAAQRYGLAGGRVRCTSSASRYCPSRPRRGRCSGHCPSAGSRNCRTGDRDVLGGGGGAGFDVGVGCRVTFNGRRYCPSRPTRGLFSGHWPSSGNLSCCPFGLDGRVA